MAGCVNCGAGGDVTKKGSASPETSPSGSGASGSVQVTTASSGSDQMADFWPTVQDALERLGNGNWRGAWRTVATSFQANPWPWVFVGGVTVWIVKRMRDGS